MLADGTLARYIADLSVTGLTSNPTMFEHAIGSGSSYDKSIGDLVRQGESGEGLFFALALQDLVQAVDLFRPVFETAGGVDGWVSLEVSLLLADDTKGTIRAAARLHVAAKRPNLFIKIPGTPAGIAAIEESVFAGVPINVTLLFSREHYLAAAAAYLRGIDRRIAAGLDPVVESVASVFVSRWDVAVKEEISAQYHNRLGIVIAMRTYTRRTVICSRPHAGKRSPGPVPTLSVCSGPAPVSRTRQRPTPSMSRRSPPPARSTRFPRRRCWRLPTTAMSVPHCGPMADTPRLYSKSSGGRVSTMKRWPRGCSAKVPRHSPSHGACCCRAWRARVRNSPQKRSEFRRRLRRRPRWPRHPSLCDDAQTLDLGRAHDHARRRTMNLITMSFVSTATDVNALASATRALSVGVGRSSAAAATVVGKALRGLTRGAARRAAWDFRVLSAALSSLAVGVRQWLVAEVQRRR